MSVGLETEKIITVLERLSKNELPSGLKKRITEWTATYGKIRLVLKHNRYYLESSEVEFLKLLVSDAVISQCRMYREEEQAGQVVFGRDAAPRRDYAIPGTKENERGQLDAADGMGEGQDIEDDLGAVIGIHRSE